MTISTMPMTGRGVWILIVSSMEQIIGAGLSTIVGVMLPMIHLVMHPGLNPVMQGVVGAAGLVGIAIGGVVIGKLCDKMGYLKWFRICPILILTGALLVWIFASTTLLILGLFLAGIGTGGGYSLDANYISELMPDKWKQRMVGLAKASCSLGFIMVAFVSWLILRAYPHPQAWNRMVLIIAAGATITLIMRIRWAESPKWLLDKGRTAEARKALDFFYGPNVELDPVPTPDNPLAAKCPRICMSMFRGQNLKKVIFAGVPWACEGLGVYGFGVFLPVLVMALGIESETAVGMKKVIDSVGVTTIVNFFILPGFVIGLLIMHRVNHVKMLMYGFIGSAVGLGILLVGYLCHLPNWILVCGFILFEVMLNAGPHLITYVIPTTIYPVAERGTGTGIASMNGKIGAIIGVVIMPLLLGAGGPKLVLIVSICVMLFGAMISLIYGRALRLTSIHNS